MIFEIDTQSVLLARKVPIDGWVLTLAFPKKSFQPKNKSATLSVKTEEPKVGEYLLHLKIHLRNYYVLLFDVCLYSICLSQKR